MNARKQQAGFGLTELLVSLGIIIVLVALLYPAFIGVTHARNTTKCISNLRNVGAVVFNYANDNGGYFPTMMTVSEGKWSNYWPDALTRYLPNTGAKTSLGYPVKNPSFFCPAQKTHGTWGDYTANPSIMVFLGGSNGTIKSAIKVSQITEAPRRMLLSDGTNGRGTGSFFLDSNFITNPKNVNGANLTGTLYPAVHNKKTMNFFFVDGHIEVMEMEKIIESRKSLLGAAQDHP